MLIAVLLTMYHVNAALDRIECHQDIWKSLRELGVTVTFVNESKGDEEHDRSKPQSEFPVVDIVDCEKKLNALELLHNTKTPFVLILGSSDCSLSLSDYLDALVRLENIRILVLDSVDLNSVQLQSLLRQRPGIQVIVSERCAIQAIDAAYRFAMERSNASSLVLSQSEPLPSVPALNDVHFEMATDFIGIHWEPQLSKPIPRYALAAFRHLKMLRTLFLTNADVYDSDLHFFSDLAFLNTIDLSGTLVEGPGLDQLNASAIVSLGLGRLKTLNLKYIGRFHNLEKLNLEESKFSSDQMHFLHELKSLKELHAAGTCISLSDVKLILEQVPSIRYVRVDHEISADNSDELSRLRKMFPRTKISVD